MLPPRNTIANTHSAFANTDVRLLTAETVESENQAVQFGPHNKPSGPVSTELGSNVAQAADILIALSTLREKGK
jgi:hypothetical protein